MKLSKKSITVFAAALAVSAVTAAPISAQVITPVQSDVLTKMYTFNFDTLKSLILKCNLDCTVNADEENGIVTVTSKDGNAEGDIVVKLKTEDGEVQKYLVDSDVEVGAAAVEYTVTVCSEIEE